MKGIVLAGGTGSRMYPITKSVSKQLLCVYDKPMIYYPISILLHAGITEILIISTPNDIIFYKKLFGDGSHLGINICYAEQPKPEGLAQAFIISEDFIGKDNVCMVLGDNIFMETVLKIFLKNAANNLIKYNKASVFGCYVDNPSRYGVIEFDQNKNVLEIVEKPSKPKSNFAVVGLYFYPNSVIELAKEITPSDRGELEITSINNLFLSQKNLCVEIMGNGLIWFDAGSPDSLLEASNYVHAIEKEKALKLHV